MVRGKGKVRGLLVVVVFCCLFEEERVIAGINDGKWNLKTLNVKKKKSIFKNVGCRGRRAPKGHAVPLNPLPIRRERFEEKGNQGSPKIHKGALISAKKTSRRRSN